VKKVVLFVLGVFALRILRGNTQSLPRRDLEWELLP
jgi:hypothetical protein